MFVPLPFLGPLSFHIRRQLQRVLHSSYPQLEFRFVFQNKNTLATLFPFKDKIPRELQSFVVYKYECCCSATYIGMTTCNLFKRVAEHRGISPRTGNKLASQPYSAIREHSLKHHHPIEPERFNILRAAQTEHSLRIFEALHIKFDKPSLNRQMDLDQLLIM